MEISNLTLDSIKRYYKVLARKGSVGTPDLYKLLVLSFIDDLLREDYYTALTEEEYPFVLGAINCISKNTCLIQSENVIYSYEGAANGWKYQSSFNFQIEQVRSQNLNTSPSSKLFDDELTQVRSDLNGLERKTNEIDTATALANQATLNWEKNW